MQEKASRRRILCGQRKFFAVLNESGGSLSAPNTCNYITKTITNTEGGYSVLLSTRGDQLKTPLIAVDLRTTVYWVIFYYRDLFSWDTV